MKLSLKVKVVVPVLLFFTFAAKAQINPYANVPYLQVGISTRDFGFAGVGYIFPGGHMGLESKFSAGWAGSSGLAGRTGLAASYYLRSSESSFYLDAGVDYFFNSNSEGGKKSSDLLGVPVVVGYRLITRNGWWKFGAGLDVVNATPTFQVSYSWVLGRKRK